MLHSMLFSSFFYELWFDYRVVFSFLLEVRVIGTDSIPKRQPTTAEKGTIFRVRHQRSDWLTNIVVKTEVKNVSETSMFLIKLLLSFIKEEDGAFLIGPHGNGIFGADADTNIREQENCNIQYISRYCIYLILAECCCQILVTKTCKGDRISIF